MQGDRSNTGKQIAWLEKQRIPTGSSPVGWKSGNASSSDDEDFDGFCYPKVLMLSNATRQTSGAVVKKLFKDFTTEVVSRTVEKDGTVTYTVEFESTALAVQALKMFKGVPLGEGTKWMHDVTLTRFVNPRYQSFSVECFNKSMDRKGIENHVKKEFKKFGKILHFFFSTEEQEKDDVAYLYAELDPGVLVQKVKISRLLVKECHMKEKETKKLAFNWDK